jgi:hypothetical protein
MSKNETSGRMMVYAWSDTADSAKETKFGDHFVPDDTTLQEAIEHTRLYVRGQFPRRPERFDSDIVLKHMWDVSEIAKAKGRFYRHSHIDDVIRKCIPGKRGTQGVEFHAASFDEAVHAVNTYVGQSNQPLPLVAATQWQYDQAGDLILEIAAGKRTFLAEFCARYGKTLWAGMVAVETNAQITIVASYVLSSFSSFAKDLSCFEQFRSHVIIDSKSKSYQTEIQEALATNKPVVVFMSMCGGDKRQERLDFLFGLPQNRLLFIDEADYGAHTKNQADPFVAARKADDIVILMTGTNGDRACGSWKIDHYMSKTYPELVMVRRGVAFGSPRYQLKSFSVDAARHQKIPPVEFYQMNLSRLVQHTRKLEPELFVDGDDRLPSWSKFGKNPNRAQGFFTNVLQAVLLGKRFDELNVAYQTNGKLNKHRVAMLFLPGSMKNEALGDAVQITQLALAGWKIIEISGQAVINGRKMTNALAEDAVRREIDEAEAKNIPVLIISRGMAQRSFSIGEISELYLCYDGGDVGATTQKISRALTAYDELKIGRIFSLSFDPNRDDKFDGALVAAARNYAKSTSTELSDALRKVLGTLDIFSCQEDGSVKIDLDTYLRQVLERNSLSRMVGNQADIDLLSDADIRDLAEGEGTYERMEKAEAADKGKTDKDTAKKSTKPASADEEKTSNDLRKRARETLVAIIEYLPYLMFATKSDSIKHSLEICQQNDEYRQYVLDAFKVSPAKIADLFARGILNYDLAGLQRSAKVASLKN